MSEPLDEREGQPAPASEGSLAELRRLLLGPERAQLRKLQEQLDNPGFHGRQVSRVLPEAIVLRAKQDAKLTTALMPTVEQILKTSVRRDPRPLSEALFPVIGPAIRKAISEALRTMMQSLNQTLDHSLSWQGMKWRAEAVRSGKPFAEIVMLHSLIYRVEQVFLIHRETGLLLQHVVGEGVVVQDAQMVSGMLTAIQDFARDSFQARHGDTLGEFHVGEVTVWIEQGPHAVLAGVIRGSPPEDLKTVFREALENIHLQLAGALESFDGDAQPCEESRPYLEACLRDQHRRSETTTSPVLWLCLVLLLAAFGSWLFFALRSHHRWTEYLGRLQAEPGIVITSTQKRGGKYLIAGLRDPLAVDPVTLLGETRLDPARVESRWQPYQALAPGFVLARAEKLLRPPRSVSLRLEGAVLVAEGAAPHSWILEARRLGPAVAGVESFEGSGLVDQDVKEIEELQALVNSRVVLFSTSETEVGPGQGNAAAELAAQIQRIEELASAAGKNLRITISGHTDSSGTPAANAKLSWQRAETVRNLLVARGVSPAVLVAAGVGSAQPVREERTEADSAMNRSVTFQVTLTEKGDRHVPAS